VKVRPDLKEASAFDDVISKCIALKPEDRFKNLEQLSEALAAVRAEASRVANSKMNEQREIAIKDKSQAESQLAVEILLVLIIVASLFFAFFGLHNLLPNMHSQSDFPRSTNGQSHFSAS
jgi:serine/threonine protein kinase